MAEKIDESVKAAMKEGEAEIPQFVRLTIRREGNFVNAYLAPPPQMPQVDVKLVATIQHKFVNTDEEFKVWRELLQRGMARAIKGALGLEVSDFVIEKAPEHERSGHG